MARRPRRVPAGRAVVGTGVALAALTAASGLAFALRGRSAAPAEGREVFGHVPGALVAALYALVPVVLLVAAAALGARLRNWERGADEDRSTTAGNVRTRLRHLRAGLSMRTVWRDPAAGAMHTLIYAGFLVLTVVTVVLEIDHQLPESARFLRGDVYRAYIAVGDTAGVAFLAGTLWAVVRRWGQRPYRIRLKTRPEHAAILGVFAVVGATGFSTEAVRIALDGRPPVEAWAYVGYPLSGLVEGWSPEALATAHQWSWGLHAVAFAAFVVLLPTTMLRHAVTAPLNMYLHDRARPKGAMRPMGDLTVDELESYGAAVVEDFTWKQLLDTDACTVCGRCTEVCPAHATGKALDPREIVLKIGEVMAATAQPEPVPPPVGVDREITVRSASVFERITAEEVWACTTCRACDEVCPVHIEILDKILDIRRHLSLVESDFPTELGVAYRGLENQANPWGLDQGRRGDWAEGLEHLAVADPAEPFDHEYLYWVGCAGSFDDRAARTTRAVADLLTRAGVDFAILGPSERCTGDPARRSGNEYLFQLLARPNVETLNGMGVRRIVTHCPHCFNTFRNEYPELGGHFEVLHHSQLLESLVASGRLDVSQARLDERLTYHDACYLGRHNDVYLAPRKVVGSLKGIDVVEMPRNGTEAMCCGAGGARMWMEDDTGTSVGDERARQALATGATRVATACPFCTVMLDDGVKAAGFGPDQVLVADVAVHLSDALRAGEAQRKFSK